MESIQDKQRLLGEVRRNLGDYSDALELALAEMGSQPNTAEGWEAATAIGRRVDVLRQRIGTLRATEAALAGEITVEVETPAAKVAAPLGREWDSYFVRRGFASGVWA